VATSDEAHTSVVAAADEGVAALTELNPGLTFTLEPNPLGGNYWSDCTNTPAPDPDNVEAMQWIANRSLAVEPKQTTAELLDPVIARLVAQGWVTGSETTAGIGRSVDMSRNGYVLYVSGDSEVDEDSPARVSVEVYSLCLDAPAEMPEQPSDED